MSGVAEPLILGPQTDAGLTEGLIGTAHRAWRRPWRLAFAFTFAGTLWLALCISYTVWRGIVGSLLEKSPNNQPVLDKPALIVGAGGASRAAVYALHTQFRASAIYIVNRDEGEVDALKEDVKRLPNSPKLIHVKPGQSADLETPYYVVGTVPDQALA